MLCSLNKNFFSSWCLILLVVVNNISSSRDDDLRAMTMYGLETHTCVSELGQHRLRNCRRIGHYLAVIPVLTNSQRYHMGPCALQLTPIWWVEFLWYIVKFLNMFFLFVCFIVYFKVPVSPQGQLYIYFGTRTMLEDTDKKNRENHNVT